MYFASVLNNSTSAGSNTAYASAYYVIGADLDFQNTSVDPVAYKGSAFSGTVYGQKHIFKNVKFKNVSCNGRNGTGAFGLIQNAYIFDIGFASSCSLTSNYNTVLAAGMLAIYSKGTTTITNCSSQASVSVTGTTTTSSTDNDIVLGGLVACAEGTLNMVKCTMTGNLTLTDSYAGNDSNRMGGLVGSYRGATDEGVVVESCYVKTNINVGSGANTGGAVGSSLGATKKYCKIYNSVIISYFTFQSNVSSPDGTGTIGWDYFSSFEMSNCYIVSNTPMFIVNRPEGTFSNVFGSHGDGGVPSSTGGNVSQKPSTYPTGVTCVGDYGTANNNSVIAKAGANSSITRHYTVASNNVTPKAAPGFSQTASIAYDLGTGASWTTSSVATTTYITGSAKPISQLGTKPTKPGFTFSKWSFDPMGTTTISNNQIPAGTYGDLTIYAIWTVNGIGNPSSSAVTYGASSVSMSAATHAAVTNNLATISYQWRKGSGTGTVLSTSATYTISNPTVADSGTYYLTTVVTPKDGRTAAKTETKTVTVTVKRKGVAVPTAATGLIYDGTAKNGVVSANTNLYTVTGGTQTKANAYNTNYTATATLKDKANYTWGADGTNVTADQSITWRIEKKSIALPVLATTSYVYTASPQSPAVTYDNNNSTYAPAGNAQTNAGTYNASITLNDTANYKWTGRSGANESDTFLLSWTIAKATPTLTAPNYIAKSGYDKGTNMYVGQKLVDFFEFDQTSGSHTIIR